MGLENHVGRVGALAVALGIGSAIVAMPGVASASPDGGTTSTGTSQNTDAGPTGGTKTAEKPSRPKAIKGTATPNATKIPNKKKHPATKRTTAAAATGDDTTASDEKATPTKVFVRRTPARGADAPATVARAKEFVAPAPKLAAVLTTVFSPRATASSPDAPEAPAASPLLWTMLAYARRPLNEQSTHPGSRVTSSSSVVASAANVQAAAVSQLPGQAYQAPVIATDGTIYQVTTGTGSARVFVLDENAQVLATSTDIDGYLSGGSVTRPNGTLIVVTSNQRGNRSTVSSVDDSGAVTKIATVTGSQNGQLRAGADGAVYFSTRIPKPFGIFGATLPYRYVRISPTNTVQTLPYDTDLALKADGTAYLVSSQGGASTLRVYGPAGATKTISLPYGSTPSAPIVGQDGTVYVTAAVNGFFGAKTTRVYALTGTSNSVRTVTGLPGATVVTADGLYLETFTYPGSKDNGTGTTYISKITTTSAETSDAITGRIAGFTFQVTPNGTVYAPITDPTLNTAAVAVVALDGSVTTTTLPGTLVARLIRTRGAATTGNANVGYVNYSAGGIDHVAVLKPDGSIARTVDLPPGATASTVFFGPDGAAYELLDYFGPDQGQTTARQIVALGTGTTTAVTTGSGPQGSYDVDFSPTGIGYLFIGQPNSEATKILGFDQAGNTVISLSTFDSPVATLTELSNDRLLTYDANGTAYVFNYAADSTAGVYALTSSGPQKVLDVNRAGGTRANGPTFGSDGTGYVTIAGTDGSTIVLSFPTVTAV